MQVWWLEQSVTEMPLADDWLSPSEKLRLADLRFPKRRTDWRLGRWTAKQAVTAYLKAPSDPQTLARIEIRSAESGAPEVFRDNDPCGVSISITHSTGIAACAVAAAQVSIGCDLEFLEPRSDAFLTDYLTEAEQALVNRVAQDERVVFSNLLWSAKESALKLLKVGLRLDTRCVEVRVGKKSLKAAESSSGHVRDWQPLTVSRAGDHDVAGWWMSSGDFVRTIVTAPSSTAPRILSLSHAQDDSRRQMQRAVGNQ
ncbi:MAG: 4'-phosphopantetheinyl transferase superfamily protein [Candidatus Korobacteraceae bacterium]